MSKRLRNYFCWQIKNTAYHFTYNYAERTLAVAEVDVAEEKVEQTLQEKFGAELRK